MQRLDILAGPPPDQWNALDRTEDRVTVAEYNAFVAQMAGSRRPRKAVRRALADAVGASLAAAQRRGAIPNRQHDAPIAPAHP